MQLMMPTPAFASIWVSGPTRATTYRLSGTPVTGFGTETRLPTARISKDGNGPDPGTAGLASARARPVVPAAGPPGRPLRPAVFVPTGATPTSALTPA